MYQARSTPNLSCAADSVRTAGRENRTAARPKASRRALSLRSFARSRRPPRYGASTLWIRPRPVRCNHRAHQLEAQAVTCRTCMFGPRPLQARHRGFVETLAMSWTVRSNVRVERRATEYWMPALYPFRVRSNALLDDMPTRSRR